MKISFKDFDMDTSIIAPVIYGKNDHHTTNKGVVLSREVTEELRRFLRKFNRFVKPDHVPYYRIDAYFDQNTLGILEINAAFVDGWGTALNLARASRININPRGLIFPLHFACVEETYLPELELLLKELNARNTLAALDFLEESYSICSWNNTGIYPFYVYVYGREGLKSRPKILPFDGISLDNKINLGLFSEVWNSSYSPVKIPHHYIRRSTPWEEIPEQVVLKFCDKGSEECKKARQSVFFNKPSGKGGLIRQCYDEEKLIAQDIFFPSKQNGENCQLVILAINESPITGYVQYSHSKIINDNSIHGPLKLE